MIIIMRKYIMVKRSRSQNPLPHPHSVCIPIKLLSSVNFPVSQTVKVVAAD